MAVAGLFGSILIATPGTTASEQSADSLDLVPIFGPEKFTRATGKPVTLVRRFDTSGFLGPFWLCIENGSDRGVRISSAVIGLNGRTVVRPEAFNPKVILIEKEIELLQRNSLTIQLRSRPGSWIRVTVLGTLPAENIVENGDFETPGGVTQWVALYQSPVDFQWRIVEGTSVDLVGPPWQAASGLQFVDLDGNFPGSGGLFQDIPTRPGATYRVRFAMAGNPQWQEIGADPIKTMDVYWDGTLLASPEADVTGHTISNMGWQYYEFEAMASSSATRLLFISTMGYSATGPTLDDVSVQWIGR